MSIFAQGSLTPPGAPAATMKTLSQIEPRTPISTAPFTINAPGSYYLTQNISVTTGNAITVNASNVTIDLNGYTISSTQNPAATAAAIYINNTCSNIAITNGHVNSGVGYSGGGYSGTGFGYGIQAGGVSNNVRVRGVNVFGVKVDGISIGFTNTIVEECTVTTAGAYGIYADSVSSSTAQNTGNSAILANMARNSKGSANINGDGVQATTAENCVGISAGSGHGINANVASHCHGTTTGTSTGDAVHVTNSAIGCVGINNGAGSYGVYSAHTVDASYGSSLNIGLDGEDIVSNSRGDGLSRGIFTFGVAVNSYGTGNIGIDCTIANSCYGFAPQSGTYGISASYVAMASSGLGGSIGINAGIAAYCIGSGNPTAISAVFYMFSCSRISGVLSGRQYFCGSGAFIYP